MSGVPKLPTSTPPTVSNRSRTALVLCVVYHSAGRRYSLEKRGLSPMVLVEGFSFQQYRADISSVPRITDEELHTLAHSITNARAQQSPHLAILATHRLT